MWKSPQFSQIPVTQRKQPARASIAVERINRELGTLAVIITHNAILADMADRVFTLSDGRIVSERTNTRRGLVCDLAW